MLINAMNMATHAQLQTLWWVICSIVGALFLFLNFVQGGQTLLWQVAKTDLEKSLVINSLGRKWEITFTTLVLFGGALFAAFPKFYATSFGGAYWVWILILFTFIIQAVSYEYRTKPGNVFGPKVYEIFLLINGVVGVLLIGAAVGTFFTGSNFTLNEYNHVTWTSSLRGLEAAFSAFNLSMGLFLVFNARVLGGLYLLNNIDLAQTPELEDRLRKSVLTNFKWELPFLLYMLARLIAMDGFYVDETGTVIQRTFQHLLTMNEIPILFLLLASGLVLVIGAVIATVKFDTVRGIWAAGVGTVFAGLALLLTAGLNNTPFYPSKVDFQSSLTIYNASSTQYTLTVMSYVALLIPFVLAYVAYVWWLMDRRKLSVADVSNRQPGEVY